MVNYKALEQDIKKNKDLEINLPQFMNAMSSVYFSYATTNLAMHYYDFYENVVDKRYDLDEKEIKLLSEINTIVKENLLSEFDGLQRETSIKKLYFIRTEITKNMQVLTAYADLFTLYEYVLNRMELRYQDEIMDIDNDTVAKKILKFIFAEKDNVVVNDRIRCMVSQMPIRMTKDKFFDILKNGLSIYEGTDQASLDDFMYRILSSAGIYEPEGMEKEFPFLAECKKIFANLDAGSVGETEFVKLSEKLKKATNYLVFTTDCYYAMQQLVNDLYTILLNFPYASLEAVCEMEKVRKIIEKVETGFAENAKQSIDEETVSLFMQTEGKLEEYIADLQKMEGLLDIIRTNQKKTVTALMLNQIFECLLLSLKLTSNSVFIEIDSEFDKEKQKSKKEIDLKSVNENDINCTDNENKTFKVSDVLAAYDKLYEALSSKLKSQPKMLNRAMIAAVLRELPVFFSNHTEVMDYVKSSLAGCRDLAEKVVSVRLMEELMSEE